MKIKEHSFVTAELCLTLDDGEVVEQTEPGDPLRFVFGIHEVLDGNDDQLEGMEAGQSKQFTLEAEDAFGVRTDEMVQKVPRDAFPDGDVPDTDEVIQIESPDGFMLATVITQDDETVTLDMNHPLAGERLHYDITVLEVRDATEEEIAAANEEESCEHDCDSCDHGDHHHHH